MLDNAIFALLRQVKVLFNLLSDVFYQLSPTTEGLKLVLNDSFSAFKEFRKVEVTSEKSHTFRNGENFLQPLHEGLERLRLLLLLLFFSRFRLNLNGRLRHLRTLRRGSL